MKNLKKVLLTGTITLTTLITMQASTKAATVQVTGEVINIRKSASTSSEVVAMLSEGVECEYLGEQEGWYKVKYKNYTGYVSKDYTKLVGKTSNENNNSESNTQTNTNSQTGNNQNTQTNSESNTQSNNQSSSTQTSGSNQNETTKVVYKKFKQNTIIRLLPLVHSSSLQESKKNDEVLILTEASGWSYIQTDEISGWVRTDTLGEAKTVTVGGSNQGSSSTSEKTGYISEEEVNLRKGAGTSYEIVKVLTLNTKVTILEEKNGWYKVKSGSSEGYVSKDYVSDSKKVTNRALSEPRTSENNEEEKTKNSESKDNNTNKDESTNKAETIKVSTTQKQENNKTDKTSNEASTNKPTSNSTNKNNNTTSSSNTIKGTDVIAYAKKYIGVPYVWGGETPKGFDCSGFSMYVYKHFGVSLPHYTVSQYNSGKGKKITKQSDLKMGDIVFLTDYETGAPCGHCGIYISNGDFIHADSSVGYVNISNLNGIYKGRFCGALRISK